MSNPQAQGSQGPPPQQQQPQLLQPDYVLKLRCLTEDQKQKYRVVLVNFWQIYQTKPAGSPEHNQAKAKLQEWSSKLIQQEKLFRAKQQQQQQNQQNQNQNQNQAQNQNQQGDQGQQNSQAQTTPQASNAQQPPAQSAQAPKPQPTMQAQQMPQQQANRPQPSAANPQNQGPSPEIQKHVAGFPYRLPPGVPDGDKKLQELKNQYMIALTKNERLANRIRQINTVIQQRQNSGQDIPQEVIFQKQQIERELSQAKKFIDEFRAKQGQMASQGVPIYGQQQSQQPQAVNQAQPQQQPTQQQSPQPPQHLSQNPVKQEPNIKVEGGQAPQPTPTFTNQTNQQNVQHPAPQQQQPHPQQPPQQQPRPPPAPHSQQQMGQHNQTPYSQPGQQQHQQPQRPQINPQQANAQMQHQTNSPHPHSAASVGPGGAPVPLSHHAAVSAAQKSYSQSDVQRTATPVQLMQGNFHHSGNREREQNSHVKMPIPRTLSTAAPVPVAMGQARPTLSGPTNGAPGAMGQPAINKFPPFQLEGEGDRVLSKRKLDELVRQVTGGAEDALTPEVEEAMLQLADEFVDTVITSACKLSKLRESPNLEIRDLQLVLERNYNIRIPGYASDEVRTVRKLVPAPGWTQKMNAVQAAKVMGGKTDI